MNSKNPWVLGIFLIVLMVLGAFVLWPLMVNNAAKPVPGAPTVPPAWTSHGGNPQNNYYSPTRGPKGRIKWRYQTLGVWSGPLVGKDHTVFVACRDGKVHAIDGKTGKLRWTSLIADVPITKRIGYSERMQLSTSAEGLCGSIDRQGDLYITGSENTVYALDGDSGRVKWTYGDKNITSSPAVAPDGRIIICTRPGNEGGKPSVVVALDPADGTTSWSTRVSSYASPITGYEGTVYVGGISALGLSTGKIRWTKMRSQANALAMGHTGAIYCNDTNSTKLYAVSGKSGRRLWEVTLAGKSSRAYTIAVGPNNTVYANCWSALFALDGTTGKVKWTYAAGYGLGQSGGALSPIVGPSGKLYLPTDGAIVVLNAATGKPIKKMPIDSGQRVGAAVGMDGTIYTATSDGKVLAVE